MWCDFIYINICPRPQWGISQKKNLSKYAFPALEIKNVPKNIFGNPKHMWGLRFSDCVLETRQIDDVPGNEEGDEFVRRGSCVTLEGSKRFVTW